MVVNRPVWIMHLVRRYVDTNNPFSYINKFSAQHLSSDPLACTINETEFEERHQRVTYEYAVDGPADNTGQVKINAYNFSHVWCGKSLNCVPGSNYL